MKLFFLIISLFVFNYAEPIASKYGAIPHDSFVHTPDPELDFHLIEGVKEYDFYKSYPLCLHPIKDQGVCGSCYAFSTLLSIRTRYCTKAPTTPDLSEQEIVSCPFGPSNLGGCVGGYLKKTCQHIENLGVHSDPDYPYVQKNNPIPATCERMELVGLDTWTVKFWGCKEYSGEDEMMAAILQDGPIATEIMVYDDFVDHHDDSIYIHIPKENEKGNIHFIVIYGWGEEVVNNSVIKYWLVENSWGDRWGVGGRGKVQKGVNTAEIEKYSLGPKIY
ncbi:tubulointerstitial nephritis antigen-like [Anaeramoeba flamelloides]|uniref:Tubulointerstitial nephritis antigen-like n=1 Tax=Anaeramoeba flamelloides TaxID=1746091 RepID=A0AAV7ZUJ6_9EUKA|nr:tubulointerstitial nephritis antigen-like [Anaeramoeba flamelloides]